MKYLFLLLLGWTLVSASERNPFVPEPEGPKLVAIIVAQQRLAILAWPDGNQVVLAEREQHRDTEVSKVSDGEVALRTASGTFTLRVGESL